MSDQFRNRNRYASDSSIARRKVVLALPASNTLGNDGYERGRMPYMPPQRRKVDLPKWGNQGMRRPYSRTPRRNIQNLLKIIADDRLVCGDGKEGEFIGCANRPSTYHNSCVDKQGDTSTNYLNSHNDVEGRKENFKHNFDLNEIPNEAVEAVLDLNKLPDDNEEQLERQDNEDKVEKHDNEELIKRSF